tara:strand:- start:6259 stop:6672 length:414 start_codon:yes stop_codon:yes gene_type:complete
MAFRFYIEPALNCVFVQHFDEYTLAEGHDQLVEMLGDPNYVTRMNILRDIRSTSLPEEFNYEYFKQTRPQLVSDSEKQLGKCKIAYVAATAKDFATAHQLSVSTRLTPDNIDRKPFRDISEARAWLDIPEDYEIKFD